MTINNMHKGKFTGKHMLAIMIAFFGVIVAVNLTMAMLANRSWTGLVVKNSYVESQKFNAKLAQSRQQADLGWRGKIMSTAGGVSATLTDGDGNDVSVDELAINFGRPVSEAQDAKVLLKRSTGGSYFGPVDLAAGFWNAEIVARHSGARDWRMNYRILVRTDGTFDTVTNDPGAKK